MYIPKLFREQEKDIILDFLQKNNFAAIVSFDGEKIVATHLPTEVVEEENGGLTIFSHMARSNPQWKSFSGQEVLLIFQGPNTYISPRWYGHVNVPTWNYTIIHLYGYVREIEGAELHSLLSRLVRNHESQTNYRLETLPPDFVSREMAGVYGFAVSVDRMDAGYKLSQNRNDADHHNIVTELEKRGDENSVQIAAAMRVNRK